MTYHTVLFYVNNGLTILKYCWVVGESLDNDILHYFVV